MSAQCPSCGREQVDGILCHQCCSDLETMLLAIPQLVDELQVSISKQARVGSSGPGGLARERSPINFGALAVRDALMVEAALWGDDIDAIRRHPQAADIVRGVGGAVKAAYRAIDRMQDRQYLGKCYYDDGQAVCVAEVWAKPGAKQVKCTACSYSHTVADRRADMLDQAEDMLFTVRDAAQVVGSYGDLKVSESTIRSYISSGQLAYHGKIKGSSAIRMGDLLAVIAERAARPSGRRLRRVS